MGALNFGYVSDDGILRGSVTPFMHFSNNNNDSKQSLGQYSDHIDGYRDVALWYSTDFFTDKKLKDISKKDKMKKENK